MEICELVELAKAKFTEDEYIDTLVCLSNEGNEYCYDKLIELGKCPFCGGDYEVIHKRVSYTEIQPELYDDEYYRFCVNCGAFE